MARLLKNFRHCSTSSLFISDSKSAVMRPVLKPEPNIEERLNDPEKLIYDLTNRNYGKINISGFQNVVNLFNDLKNDKQKLEIRRNEISEIVKKLNKTQNESTQSEIEKYKLEGKLIREDLRALMKAFWDIEERVMLQFLSLPNKLNPKTPLEETVLYDKKPKKLLDKRINHLDIGMHKGILDYRNPYSVYLTDSAAFFEYSLQNHFVTHLRNAGFCPIIAPDFVTSVIVEGGAVLDNELLKLESPAGIFLVGGASSLPMYAMYCKQIIPSGSLPCRYVHYGRRYQRPSEKQGLYGSAQRSGVSFFTMGGSLECINEELQKIQKLLTNLYLSMDYGLRITQSAASVLKPWESHRISFQLYSPFLNDHVEVASISLSETYIAERLLIKQDNGKMCHLLSGTAIDVTSTLAVVLEQGNELAFSDTC